MCFTAEMVTGFSKPCLCNCFASAGFGSAAAFSVCVEDALTVQQRSL